ADHAAAQARVDDAAEGAHVVLRRGQGPVHIRGAAFYRRRPGKPGGGVDSPDVTEVARNAPATPRLDVLKALGDNARYAIYLVLARSPRPLATAEDRKSVV